MTSSELVIEFESKLEWHLISELDISKYYAPLMFSSAGYSALNLSILLDSMLF